MKNLFFLFLAFSCSSVSFKVEQNKYRVGDTKTAFPNFYLPKEKIIFGRTPASVNQDMALVNKKYNARKLYFLTLYSQAEWMRAILGKQENQLRICPRFHHELQVEKERFEQMAKQVYTKNMNSLPVGILSKEHYPYFPEVALKIDSKRELSEKLFTASSQETKSLMSKAMERYYEANIKELKTLCEYGRSDYSYVFENLIHHFKTKGHYYNQQNLKAILKVPVFANLVLTKSLSQDFSGPTYGPFEKLIVQKTGTLWIVDYISYIKNKRKTLLAQAYNRKN